jgi:hypothetical protein
MIEQGRVQPFAISTPLGLRRWHCCHNTEAYRASRHCGKQNQRVIDPWNANLLKFQGNYVVKTKQGGENLGIFGAPGRVDSGAGAPGQAKILTRIFSEFR